MRLHAVVDRRSGNVEEWWESVEEAAAAVRALVAEDPEREGALAILEVDLPDSRPVRVEPGSGSSGLGQWLRGTILSQSGSPQPAASVSACQLDGPDPGTEIGGTATAADGRFTTPNVWGPGRYRVEVHVHARLRAVEEVVVPQGGADVTIRLPPDRLSPGWLPPRA
jgi:hypothetical protein